MGTVRFDIDAYKRRTGRLDLDGIDFGAFVTQPVPPDALRCLRYMHDVEYHTVASCASCSSPLPTMIPT